MSIAAPSRPGSSTRRRESAHRRDLMWFAALVHRLSGLALALFLPFHFLVLALAIKGEARLDGFLRWTDQPIVKLAEAGLVTILVMHLLGGLRLLVIEMWAWRGRQKASAVAGFALAVAAGVVFLLRAL